MFLMSVFFESMGMRLINCKGGAIAQLVRPLTVISEVPGWKLSITLEIFQKHF
jgi:hypothetical protein